MSKRDKRLAAARNNPRGFRFSNLESLLTQAGFALVRQSGSHKIYQHPKHPTELVNLQETKDGNAKPYQVEQVVAAIERCRQEKQS